MKELQSGDKIKYRTSDDKWANGVIHGVRKVDTTQGPKILSYLIDTGKEHPDHKGRTDKQPEQVEVLPEDVRIKA